jgi:hypothetical protein
VRLRRMLVTLALSATPGLVAGCGQESDGTTPGAAPTTSAAAASPTAGGKAATEAVCKAIIDVYAAEKLVLINAYGQYVTATILNDQAKIPAARARVEDIIRRLSQAARAELAKVADPQLKAALEDYVAVVEEVYLNPNEDTALDAKLQRTISTAQRYCPSLEQ